MLEPTAAYRLNPKPEPLCAVFEQMKVLLLTTSSGLLVLSQQCMTIPNSSSSRFTLLVSSPEADAFLVERADLSEQS